MTLRTQIIIILPALAMAVPALAISDESHRQAVVEVVNEIAGSQNISSQSDVTCDAVTDDQFEELGDAVMQAMIGDDQQHEIMDNMMGGEGSESLRSMHIAMGQRYLGCAQGQFGTMGMMGGMMSMMGSGWRGGDGLMMGGSWGIGMLLFWLIVIVGIVLFVKWVSGQSSSQKGTSALDILKERYAKGEINKEEFEAKKKDLF